MDVLDRRLLTLAQTSFPLVSRPFRALGEELGLSENEVLIRLRQLQDEGIVRRIGAFFDSHRLGYHSTLCALRVPADRLDKVSALVNSHAEVTHNYLREHDYNMWFTLIAPSSARVAGILTEVRTRTGLDGVLNLPAVRLFKIRAVFALEEEGAGKNHTLPSPPDGVARESIRFLSRRDRALIRALQADLALEPAPFALLAGQLSLTEEEILAGVGRLLAAGVIRRLGPALRHHRAGFAANAMVVWDVPGELVARVGETMAASPCVTHCYERLRLPEWRYNLYTMIHGPDRTSCREITVELAQKVGITAYEMLFTRAELKKSSMQYALEEEDAGG